MRLFELFQDFTFFAWLELAFSLVYFEGRNFLMAQKFTSLLILFLTLLSYSCTKGKKENLVDWEVLPIDFASGFSIKRNGGFTLVEVSRAYPEPHTPFRYLIVEGGMLPPEGIDADAVIRLPVSKVVLTSTPHVPHLDLLGNPRLLAGFPNLDLISTPSIRNLIKEDKVLELGKGASPNAELLLELEPDWVMFSSLGEDPKLLELCRRAGIPTVLSGEYLERHPLGRAEWIKLTGALTGNIQAADSIFAFIKEEYKNAEERVVENPPSHRPSVLSGVMYQDIWYAPGGSSWAAELIEKAGGEYVFQDLPQTGSAELSYEFVLDRAMEADFWVGAADYNTLEEMRSSKPRYANFEAFQKGKVFTYTAKKGETGGLMYFEEGYMRPDLVLKDLIKIFHPHLLTNHSLYFYQKL
jgi:iron complex transport system substrate-binding protein